MLKAALLRSYLTVGLGIALFAACGNDAAERTAENQSKAVASESTSDEASPATQPFITDDRLYSWVDNLNIRDTPKPWISTFIS